MSTMREDPVHESRQSLWILTVSPLIWATHFLLCYLTAAVWCEKFAEPDGSLGLVRPMIALYTAIALAGIGITGRAGFRRQAYVAGTPPHDADTPEDRHRFLGFATLLLSGVSVLAVIYASLAAIFIGTCN